MGLDVVFRARSKFDPRYSTEVGISEKLTSFLHTLILAMI